MAVVIRTAQRCRPDVVILDADMPGGSVFDTTIALNRHVPRARSLLIVARDSPEFARRALNAHVSGVVLKDSPVSELARAVRAVAAGELVIDQKVAIAALSAPANPLTERELEILTLVAAGAEPTEIARNLKLRVGTVRNYLAAIVTKLGARNRVDAIRIAEGAGWLLPLTVSR